MSEAKIIYNKHFVYVVQNVVPVYICGVRLEMNYIVLSSMVTFGQVCKRVFFLNNYNTKVFFLCFADRASQYNLSNWPT